jgi:DNA-directed RNA polymerase subunit N (RpoN/RPB10)
MPKNLDKKNLITCMSFVYWLRLIYSFIKKNTQTLEGLGVIHFCCLNYLNNHKTVSNVSAPCALTAAL